MRDTRSVDERTFGLQLGSSSSLTRTPLRDYVTQVTTSNAGISQPIPTDETTAVLASVPRDNGGNPGALVTLGRSNSTENWASTNYYRPGDRALHNDKHWQAMKTGVLPAPVAGDSWQEMYVHTANDYRPEDYFKNVSPVIIFDNDTENDEDSDDLGYDLSNPTASSRSWFDDPDISIQLRTATDYRGVHRFLMSIGFTSSNADRILIPDTAANRAYNPASGAINGSGNPSGGVATGWAQWPLNFRRPSNIRLFGHAYEWAGYLNYSKGLPKYQGELSGANKFTYYGTNEDGGKVYFSGFNEEGFSVSPRGVEDIQSGEVVGLEEIGNQDRDISIITNFPALTVDELTVDTIEAQKITGDITWGGVGPSGNTYPLHPTWSKYGNTAVVAAGPLPALPTASTPAGSNASDLGNRGITRYSTTAEVDAIWTAANQATPPATAGVDNAAITPASLYSMVEDILAEITTKTAANPKSVQPGMTVWYGRDDLDELINNNLEDNGQGTGTDIQAWVICNGSAYSRTTYKRLFDVIGETFGAGDGSTTFNVPDMQGKFARGWTDQDTGAYNNTTNPDPDRTFGSQQDDAVEQHGHSITDPGHDHTAGGQGGNNSPGGQSGGAPAGLTTTETTDITIDNPSVVTTGQTPSKANDNETRVNNIAFLPLMKS